MATWVWVNIGSGNGLLCNGTKPLHWQISTSHWRGSVAFAWEQFHSESSNYHSQQWIWMLTCEGLLSMNAAVKQGNHDIYQIIIIIPSGGIVGIIMRCGDGVSSNTLVPHHHNIYWLVNLQWGDAKLKNDAMWRKIKICKIELVLYLCNYTL